jgi:hypothetical protein
VPDETKDSERLWPAPVARNGWQARRVFFPGDFSPEAGHIPFPAVHKVLSAASPIIWQYGYGKLGQKALALQALDMALELDPDYEPAVINRAVVESLKEGEKLPPDKVESVEYYKDYALAQKSYIRTLIQHDENSIKS